MPARLAIFDVDGTLVDSTYHHALAWQRAFRAHELTVPMWRIHREIGKGGDRLVAGPVGGQGGGGGGGAPGGLPEESDGEASDEGQPPAGAHEPVTPL